MDIHTPVFIAAFMSPPAASLIYAWRKSSGFPALTWREKLLQLAPAFATVSLLLISAFLINGWNWNAQSFMQSPALTWRVLSQIGFWAWIVACCAALLGKGRIRRAMLIWSVGFPAMAVLVVWMGFIY